jgi:hypothetical protein
MARPTGGGESAARDSQQRGDGHDGRDDPEGGGGGAATGICAAAEGPGCWQGAEGWRASETADSDVSRFIWSQDDDGAKGGPIDHEGGGATQDGAAQPPRGGGAQQPALGRACDKVFCALLRAAAAYGGSVGAGWCAGRLGLLCGLVSTLGAPTLRPPPFTLARRSKHRPTHRTHNPTSWAGAPTSSSCWTAAPPSAPTAASAASCTRRTRPRGAGGARW